jgi:hypothetical protein
VLIPIYALLDIYKPCDAPLIKFTTGKSLLFCVIVRAELFVKLFIIILLFWYNGPNNVFDKPYNDKFAVTIFDVLMEDVIKVFVFGL